MFYLILLGVAVASVIGVLFIIPLFLLERRNRNNDSSATQLPSGSFPYRNTQLKKIADAFGLSFISDFPFSWKISFEAAFSTKVGRPVNEMRGIINGHGVLVRESLYSLGSGLIRTYIEIDGRGEMYVDVSGMQRAIPLDELWTRLRALAGVNVNIAETLPDEFAPNLKSMKKMDVIKLIVVIALLFILAFYLISTGRYSPPTHGIIF